MNAQEIRQVIARMIPEGIIVPEHTATEHFYRHVPSNQLFKSVTTKTNILESGHLKKWAAQLAIEVIDKNWDRITVENKHEYFEAAIMNHQNTFEDAGNVGTQGHGVVERYLLEWMNTGVRPDDIRKFIIGDDIRLFPIARSAEMFCKDFDVIPIASELLVASLKHGYAGTLDSMMMLRKVLVKNDEHYPHDIWLTPKGKMACTLCPYRAEYIFTLVDWKTSNDINKVQYAMQVSAYWQAFYEMTGIKPKEIVIVRLDKKIAKYEVLRVVNRADAFTAFKHVAWVSDWMNNGELKLLPYNEKTRVQLIAPQPITVEPGFEEVPLRWNN